MVPREYSFSTIGPSRDGAMLLASGGVSYVMLEKCKLRERAFCINIFSYNGKDTTTQQVASAQSRKIAAVSQNNETKSKGHTYLNAIDLQFDRVARPILYLRRKTEEDTSATAL